MKKIVKIFIIVSLFIIGIGVDGKVNAKSDTKDLENFVDKFFKIQQEYSYEKKDSDDNYKTTANSESSRIENLFSNLKIRNKKLEDFFLDYIKYKRVITTKSNIEEEIVREDIHKIIEEESDKIIVLVNRVKESIYTTDGVKSDKLSYESSKYKFVFDKDTHELIEYIPNGIEERTLMESDMDYVIREESKARDIEKILRKKVKEDGESSTETRKLSPLAYGTYNFNRIKMVEYANKHAYNYNPNYGDFTNYGGDCTNFVSQIIRAGNAPLDESGSYKWYYRSMSNRAPAWSSANKLFNYLINNDYIGPQGKLANSTDISYNMQGGDPVFIDFNRDNVIDHAVSITKVQIGAADLTEVASHTDDKLDYRLSNYGGYKKYVKLTKYGNN